MRPLRLFRTITAMALAAMALTGCDHKELCFDHAHTADVNVVFDWAQAPDADPVSMTVYLFPLDGSGQPLRYDFTDRAGGTARVPLGRYEALCFNGDTENTRYNNTSGRSTFEITTRSTELLSAVSVLGIYSDTAPRAEGTDGERVTLEPDMLWSGCVDLLDLSDGDPSERLLFTPRKSVTELTVEITNVANLKYTEGISAAISGVAGGLMPGLGHPSAETVTVPFGMTVSADKTSVSGTLRIFGHCHQVLTAHKLTVYALLSDGTRWYYTYDVTRPLHDAGDGDRLRIELDGLPLPKPIVNGGGFHPDVNEWQNIDIGIDM